MLVDNVKKKGKRTMADVRSADSREPAHCQKFRVSLTTLLFRSEWRIHSKDNNIINVRYCTTSLCENVGRCESRAKSMLSLSRSRRSLPVLSSWSSLQQRATKRMGRQMRAGGVSCALPHGDRSTPFDGSERREERKISYTW